MENSKEAQLKLIQDMIKTAQGNYADDSNSFLLWGVVISLASITQFILMKAGVPNDGIGWLILIPIAVILQIWFVIKQKKEEKAESHIEALMSRMWVAFGISLFIVLGGSQKLQLNTYPVILCLYAISLFISGGALQLRALYFGAVVCWLSAVISFFVEFQYQLLILAFAVIVGYLIPGILLKSKLKTVSNV